MADLPEAGARLTLDLDEWNRKQSTVLADAAKIDADLKKLGGSIDTKINIDDSELKGAAGLVDDLDSASPNVKVNADDSELSDAMELLEQIRTLSVIDIALSVTGTGLEVIKSLPGLGQTISNDNATAILQAFGEFNPDELAIAQNLFANNMVESVEAGALLINQLKAMGVGTDNLEDAANGAVNASQAFLAVGQEADTSAIAVAQHQLVINGLAKDYQEAADIIATGVGSGLNQRDDFLDTIIEYSSTFREAGFTAGEFLSTLNSGLESGFDNTDRVADLFREFSLRAFNVEETAAQDSLKALGLGDEAAAFQAGEITGGEFFKGVVSAIQKEPDPAKQQAFGANIFGTQFEDFGMQTVFGLDPINEAFDTIEGRAAEVATLLNDTIGNTFTELFNTINLEVADLLSSDTLDLDGKIQAIKDGFTKAIDVLQEGGTFGDAIEVGFGISGVDTALHNIERVFGQFVIAVLEVVAALQDPLGINDNDKGTRAEIARLATQQLPFDIKLANPEELETIVGQAAKRGVTDLGGAFTIALDELVAEGDYAKVSALLDELASNAEVSPEAINILKTKYETLIAEAQAAANPPPEWTSAFGAAITKAVPDDLDFGRTKGKEAGAAWWESFKGEVGSQQSQLDLWAGMTDTGDPMAGAGGGILGTVVSATQTAVENLDTATETATTNTANAWSDLNVSLTEDAAAIVTQLDTTAAKVEELDTRAATALTGNTVTTSFDMVMQSAAANFPAVIAWFDKTAAEAAAMDVKISGHVQHLLNILHDLQFLSAQVATGIQAAITLGGQLPPQPVGGGAGGGNNTTINNNVNVSNNVQSNAQAVTNGYAIGASLRPGGV